jgi:TonB family protein
MRVEVATGMTANILVVEYEQRYVDQVRAALADSQHHVQVAGDLDRAVEICAHFEPQLVIITSVLPRLRIEDAITQLRARAGLRLTPFMILMSGYDGSDHQADAAEYGAQDIMERPFTRDALRARVERMLSSPAATLATQAIPQDTLEALRRGAEAAGGGESLTSDELFGDIVSDVERDVVGEEAPAPEHAPPAAAEPPPAAAEGPPAPAEPPPVEPVAAPPPEDVTPAPEYAAPAPGDAAPAPPSSPEGAPERRPDVDQALADVIEEGRAVPKIRRLPSAERDVDDILSETLSGLDIDLERVRSAGAPSEPPAPEVEATPEVGAPEPAAPEVGAPELAEPVFDVEAGVELVEEEAPEEGPAEDDEGIAPPPEPELAEPPPPEPSGTQFGQYILEEHIATGGMAEVYRARMLGMEGFQKTVAIKRILPQLTDNEEFVTMLIDEAKLAAQLNHNNIIHIYDLGRIDRSYYIAMEYIEGEDLRSILQNCRELGVKVPVQLAVHVTALMASALDYAHKKRDFENRDLGLVHRDVSPQNVLISNDGDIKLCDFGIAKAASKATQTRAGALKGKLQYMSPEQAWGRDIDHRSDIFSLGLVFYEMLTGEPVFSGGTERSVLEQARDPKVSAPSKLNPELSLEIDRIVLQALEPDPELRYQSARDLQRDLEAVARAEGWAPDRAGVALLVNDPEAAAAGPLPVAEPVAEAVLAEDETLAADETVPAGAVGAEALAATAAEAPPPTKSRRPLWLMLIGAVLIAAVLGMAHFFGDGLPFLAAEPTPVPAVVPPPEPTPTSTPGDEELLARVSELAEAEVARREEELRRRLEEEFPTPTPLPPTSTPTATATATPSPTPTATPPPPTPTPIPPTETPIPPTPTPSVREGDIVKPGFGVIPPVVINQVEPRYPPVAREMRMSGSVDAEALVGIDGTVEQVRIIDVSRRGVGFEIATEEAVLQWRYKAATKHGVRVRMWVRIQVPFRYR